LQEGAKSETGGEKKTDGERVERKRKTGRGSDGDDSREREGGGRSRNEIILTGGEKGRQIL
jgi:hypothetical protein